jgi:FMN phosphatase YigB (HAD superfamily)
MSMSFDIPVEPYLPWDYGFDLDEIFGWEDFEETSYVFDPPSGVEEVDFFVDKLFEREAFATIPAETDEQTLENPKHWVTYARYPLKKEPKQEYAELWERFWNEKDEVKRRKIWEQLPKYPGAEYDPGATARYLLHRMNKPCMSMCCL